MAIPASVRSLLSLIHSADGVEPTLARQPLEILEPEAREEFNAIFTPDGDPRKEGHRLVGGTWEGGGILAAPV